MDRARESCLAGSHEAWRGIALLDDKGRERLTLAPETAHRLLRGICDAATITFIRSSYEAELVVAGHALASADLWTALADRYFPALTGGAPPGCNRWDFDAQIPYTSPSVGSIVIDSLSPHTREIFGPHGRVSGDPSPGNAQEVHRKVVAGTDLLEKIDPGIAAFVDREITTLVIRNDGMGNATGSSSSPQFIGRVIFWNAHFPTVGVPDCAEQLLHEAIHCRAYRIELGAPFVTAAPSLEQVV
jgi:hypothetical protein